METWIYWKQSQSGKFWLIKMRNTYKAYIGLAHSQAEIIALGRQYAQAHGLRFFDLYGNQVRGE